MIYWKKINQISIGSMANLGYGLDLPVQDVLYYKDKMFRFIIKPSKLYVSFLMEWYEAGATSMTTVGRLTIP